MVDDRPYKAGVVGSSPTVPTISDGALPRREASFARKFKF